MKILAPILLLSALAAPARGQATAPVELSCETSVLFSYHYPHSRYDAPNLLTAYVTTPAKFPNPAKTEYVSKPFTINCDGVVGQSTLTTFELRGPIEQRLKLLVSPFKESASENSAIPGKMVVAFTGDYVYPSIRKNWYQDRVFFTLDNGLVSFNHEGTEYKLLKDVVIGARVNGGALQPLFFQGQLEPLTHDRDDLVELYVKGEHRAFDYLALDFGKGIITLKNGVPFPSK